MTPAHTDQPFLTLANCLQAHAARVPERPLYRFLNSQAQVDQILTFAALHQQAAAIGAQLAQRLAPGQRALLLFPPGLEFIASFMGCLYAGVVAVPVYLPSARAEHWRRLKAIALDAAASVVLVDASHAAAVDSWLAADTELAMTALQPDPGWTPALAAPRPSRADDLAFLQYTSGSTGAPKGVMVSHGNLLHNQALIQRKFGHDHDTVVAGWLPQYHDMGLIGNILQPLYLGARAVLMAPQTFLQQPLNWLRAITEFGATTSGGPDFAYRLCAQRIRAQDKAGLDLRRWKLAFSGAEPVQASTLALFSAAFAECGFARQAFYPCYGLAEATLLATGVARGQPTPMLQLERDALERGHAVPWQQGSAARHAELVSCGDLDDGTAVRLVHAGALRLCADGEVGEIWLSGPSVAQGYWAQPERTAEQFGAMLADGSGPYLRTGDLGLVRDGQLYITGRLKDLIIVRGRNYYPQDIEAAVQAALPALRSGAAACFAVAGDAEEQVVLVQELERSAIRHAAHDQLWQQVCQLVAAQFGIRLHQLVLVKPGTVPRTSSGKVRRAACRAAWLAQQIDAVAQFQQGAALTDGQHHHAGLPAVCTTARERTALALLARVLAQPPAQLPASASLGACGLDSLAAAELAAASGSELGTALELAELLDGMTVQQFVQRAGTAAASALPAAASAATTTALPLASYNARAIWQVQTMYPACAAFQLGIALQIDGALDAGLLQRTLAVLAQRHPALSLRYREEQGQLLAQAHLSGPGWRHHDARGWSDAELQQAMRLQQAQPFDLAHDPLWRVGLYRRADHGHALHLTVHHIAVDAWALQALFADLVEVYTALASGKAVDHHAQSQPASMAASQRQWLDSPAGHAALQRYRATLADLPTIVNLPADKPRPAQFGFTGGDRDFSLPATLVAAIRQHAAAQGATLFAWLLAAWQIMLYRYSGQHAFLLGAPVSERDAGDEVDCRVDLKLFATRIDGSACFNQHLAATRANALEVLACRRVPTQLALQGSTRPSAWPAAVAPNVRFALQQAQRLSGSAPFMFGLPGTLAAGSWSLQPLALHSTVAVADLSLTLLVDDALLHGRVNYNGQLFGRQRIEQLCAMFVHLLHEIVAAPATLALDALPLQSPQEAAREMARAHGPLADYGPALAVHRLFEQQVRRAPDAVAVVCGDERCSYRELDARADLVAAHLRQRALGAEPRVGLYMRRSVDMVAAFMGALKAGACTVMLESSLPAARIAYIMQNSQMALVMTDAASAPHLSDCALPLLDIGALPPCPDAPPAAEVGPDHAAYIIYTSGSTGQPKGVIGLHRGIANRTRWMIGHFGLSAHDRVLHTTPLGFVRAEREILFPLSAGATLVLLPGAGLNDPDAVLAALRDHAISYSASSPSLLRMMLDQDPAAMSALPQLKRWFIGADALKPALVLEIQQVLPSLRLTYFYGSTEVSSDVAYYDVPAPYQMSGLTTPIGLPLSNTTIHLLNQQLQPVPAGMPGQLYIGGVQLARGYFGHAQLTQEKFIADPFSQQAGARLYASGDMGYRLPDGNLVIIGRNDDQVKIHGHRIELGEIEHALRDVPGVRDVAVLVHHKDSEHPLLVAYLVAGRAVDRQQLRPQLAQRLPPYMIPGVFLQLPQLPVTTLGKLDRSALMAMPLADAAQPQVAPPANALETAMVQQLSQVLGLPAAGIGTDDNFFELGANSAAMSQFVAALRTAQPQLTLRIADVYQHYTIGLLAAALSARSAAAPAAPAASQSRAQARRRAMGLAVPSAD